MFTFLISDMVCIFPLFIILGFLFWIISRIAGRRGSGVHIFGVTLFSCILGMIFNITGLPDFLGESIEIGNCNFNFIPFKDLGTSPFQYIANLILFIPVGFCIPVLWRKMSRLYEVLLTGFFLSFCIEFLQMFTFRAVDVDDLIMNTLGTLAGFALYMLARRLFPHFISRFTASEHNRLWYSGGWLITLTGTLLLCLFIVPIQYNFIYSLVFG